MLYIVATPIGNLGDMTQRAVEVLCRADIIAAEDTRQSMKLLSHFNISPSKLVSYHKFNETASAEGLVSAMKEGRDVAVITDAGTPCISDPGTHLVERASEEGIQITAVPGACAAIAALSVSGIHAVSFAFYGFLPRGSSEISNMYQSLRKSEISVSVFYESPLRIIKSVEILEKELPEARVCLCNDLTKKFERYYRGSPEEVLAQLRENPRAAYGEYVLVLEYTQRLKENASDKQFSPEAWILERMLSDKCSIREAADALIQEGISGYSKNQLKRAGIGLKNMLKQNVAE